MERVESEGGSSAEGGILEDCRERGGYLFFSLGGEFMRGGGGLGLKIRAWNRRNSLAPVCCMDLTPRLGRGLCPWGVRETAECTAEAPLGCVSHLSPVRTATSTESLILQGKTERPSVKNNTSPLASDPDRLARSIQLGIDVL